MPAVRYQNAYIALEEDTRQRLEFQMFPEEITDTKNAEWAAVPIIGRAEPYRVYASSGPRSISLTLHFFASTDQDDTGVPDDVLQAVAFLRSLVYPDLRDGIVIPPPVVLLIIGRTFDLRGIVESYSATYREPWELPDIVPHRAEVQLTIAEVNLIPPTSTQIRSERVASSAARGG
jgi:hypothetical protein